MQFFYHWEQKFSHRKQKEGCVELRCDNRLLFLTGQNTEHPFVTALARTSQVRPCSCSRKHCLFPQYCDGWLSTVDPCKLRKQFFLIPQSSEHSKVEDSAALI